MAFPSNAQKFAQPYGVRLSAVPPSSEIVEIEIWAKQHGSTEVSTWIGTIGAQQHYAFQHDLPYTTQAWDYKARSVAAGKLPSTFTRELVVRPAPLPYIGIGQGAAVEKVLGEELPIVVSGADFGPVSRNTIYFYNNASVIRQSTATGTATLIRPISLSPGLLITSMDAIGRSDGAASLIEVAIGYATSDDTNSLFTTLSLSNTSSVATPIASTAINHSVQSGYRYFLRTDLTSTGSLTSYASLLQARVFYRPNSYTQVRS